MSIFKVAASIREAARMVEKALCEEKQNKTKQKTEEQLKKALEKLKSSAEEIESWSAENKKFFKKIIMRQLDKVLDATDRLLEKHPYESIPSNTQQKIDDILYETGKVVRALIDTT